jgi:hypothetical protein
MPVYFMRVSDGASVIQVLDGEYHSDDASVIQAAQELARTARMQGDDFHGQRIEISDAYGRQVATVDLDNPSRRLTIRSRAPSSHVSASRQTGRGRS